MTSLPGFQIREGTRHVHFLISIYSAMRIISMRPFKIRFYIFPLLSFATIECVHVSVYLFRDKVCPDVETYISLCMCKQMPDNVGMYVATLQ